MGVLLMVGAAAILPAPAAAAATAPDGGPLTVISGGGAATHRLVPGATFVWPVEVTADVPALDALLGRLSVAGGLARSDDITAEVVSCAVPWAGERCAVGEHTVLAPTPLDRLPEARSSLQPTPRPGTTHVEVRIHVESEARIPDDAGMTATLRVDASGPDAAQADTADRSASTGPALGLSALPGTGGGVPGYGGLAVASIAAGLLLAGLAALLRRRRGNDA